MDNSNICHMSKIYMLMKSHSNQYSPSKARQIFFVLIFCCFYQIPFSQTIDSLENLLSQAVDLEEKIDLYQALILIYTLLKITSICFINT